MEARKVVIVGGGIGGMALAAALTHRGRVPLVLEQASQLGEVGSGLGVLPNAVHALRSIGVGEELFAQAAALRRMCVSNRDGRNLSDLDLTDVFRRVGAQGYVMHRTALHGALAQRVDPRNVRTGARVSSVRESADGVELILEGESEPIRADVVVGADGLRSAIRTHLLGPVPPRYAGETIFRGIADWQSDEADTSREIFGDGRRLGYYPIGAGKTYYWATAPEKMGTQIPAGERLAFLRERFAGWPFAVPELLAHTPAERVLQNDIFDRPALRTWHRGRAVLLGDAAHPMTPNMGQGACMAIEDAVVLGRMLCEHEDIERAFVEYERARIARTAMMMRISRVWGAMGLWHSAALSRIRDGFYRATPDAIFERILEDQYGYRADL